MTVDLVKRWATSGVEKGDVVLIHSNIKRTMVEYRRIGMKIMPEDILDSFLEAVGERGTIILPLFNFDFSFGAEFDIRHTQSQMGALTEAGRRHCNAVRTGHPIYSFAAIGHDAEAFRGVDNKSGYAEDSPFGLLKELGGKISVLDLPDQNSMTFYHHVEEVLSVDYRFFKDFSGSYVDDEGVRSIKTYTLFVRNIDLGVETHVDPAGELMWGAGLYKGSRQNTGTGLRTIEANAMFDFVSDLIRDNKALGNLYTLDGSK